MNNKSAGPRTPQGKARSAQNAMKHGIFVPRVLPQEEEAATRLGDGIRRELRVEGLMELSVCNKLVQIEIQADRIEQYAVSQIVKAQEHETCDLEKIMQRYTPLVRCPVPEGKDAENGFLPRMRPDFCIVFLSSLRKSIGTQGLRPDFDLDFLRSIYGDQMTAIGEGIRLLYQLFTITEKFQKTNKKSSEQKTLDYKAEILEAIDGEIKLQESLGILEKRADSVTSLADQIVILPDHIQDRIERYRTAIDRRRSRSLGDLETIRRLKGAQ